MDKNLSIIKSNELANGLYNLSLNESRFIETACAQLSNKDKIFPTVTFMVKDVLELSNVSDRKIYLTLCDTVERLSQRTVKIQGVVKGKKAWVVFPWLDKCKYYDGIVELKLHDDLIPFLLQIRGEKKNFTIYKLGDVLCLPTFYAQRLFIILKSHLNLKKVRASVPDWKSMFGLSEDQYKLYGHFKSRVVLPAINNVKDSTYIERINVVEEKRGRKVEFITLEFESYIGNQQLQLNQENSEKQESKRDDSTKELIRSLTIHDIKPEIVLEAVKKHGLEGTLECRDYALKMIEQKRTTDKPVVNIGGYIARCFKNGWGIESKEKKAAKAEIERKKEVVRQQENNKQLLDKIKKDVDNNRKTKLKTLINSLTDDQNIKMKHEFENEVLTGIHPEILQEFNVSGWSGISVKIIYKNVFLPRKLLQTVDDDYREYSRKLGYNYDELSIHG